MCTGSGCILLSLLHYSNDCRGTGADISQEALAVAGENARRLGIQVCFLRSDLFEKIEDKYDICIMDNHPGMTVATYNGLMAANKVLIITTTDIYAMQGLKAMLEYFSSIKEERKKDDIYYDESILDKSLNLEGCLVNKYIYNPNFTKRKEYNYLKTNIRMVPRNKIFLLDKAVIEHKAAVEIMPKSNFAKDIKRLANELIDNIIK